MSEDKVVRLLIFGKSGCGKSLTGNTILGQVRSSREVWLSTCSCSISYGTNRGNDIEITDFTGLFNIGRTDEKGVADMVQTVAFMDPGPTAILYVISLGNRYTEEDKGFYERLKSVLGLHLAQYVIIIFTRGDDLKRKKDTIEGVLSRAPDRLREVLVECGNRYVVFDNTADDKQPQVNRLLQQVRKLSEAHGGRPYTCPKYGEEGKNMEEEVARRLRKVEEDEVRNKKYVQAVEEKKKISQEEAERGKREFELKNDEHMKEEEETRIHHLETMMQITKQSFSMQQLIANEKYEQQETMAKEIRELKQTIKELKQNIQALQDAQLKNGDYIQTLNARLDERYSWQNCIIL